MDVTLQLEHFDELKLPTPSSQAPPTDETHPPQPSSATGVASSSGANVNATPPSGSRSARRNLTRSFEEASLSTPSTKGTAGEERGGRRGHLGRKGERSGHLVRREGGRKGERRGQLVRREGGGRERGRGQLVRREREGERRGARGHLVGIEGRGAAGEGGGQLVKREREREV